ncbi:3-hydroxymyristoyl/3-hydroxydecanoyl-(acyl carrier protein) dehydratase [Polaromonas sp. CF318]|jgi:3-hydroxyacyl-[acyl-carrier-protein] dehydratase|nr:beta-hydroxyacyl-ACP dehydratase [Polaromonas sp. CF318]EJL80658.1 3-hydroxymyristoyl/3-hydroxydecanoyl-(acyl carrier protein) dehydratase [Polaromonas sp. CF318]
MQLETRFVVAPDHPAFAGHFPGNPIVPGVLLLDAAVHAVQQALEAAGAATRPCEISAAKFLSPVGPGETLTVSCSPGARGIHFEIRSGTRQAATGTLVLPPPP